MAWPAAVVSTIIFIMSTSSWVSGLCIGSIVSRGWSPIVAVVAVDSVVSSVGVEDVVVTVATNGVGRRSTWVVIELTLWVTTLPVADSASKLCCDAFE
jgi:hypothetical protein